MRSRATLAVVLPRVSPVVLGIGMLFLVALGTSTSATALDTSVQAVIDQGDVNPSLTLDGDGTTVSTSTLPFNLSGTSHDLTQINVYVDGILSVTIPVDQNTPAFHYGITIPTGMHTIQLIGISPLPNIVPTANITLVYTPPGSPQTPSPSSGGAWKGEVMGNDGDSANSTLHIDAVNPSGLPDWLYNGLLVLNIIKTNNSGSASVAQSVQRISVVGVGLFFFVFSRPALFAYRWVRYERLGFRKRPLPEFMRNHPIGHIRALGFGLIVFVFLFL